MDRALQRLLEIDGVLGALCVGKDGLVAHSTLEADQEELVGAMVAAAFDATERYIDQLGAGQVRYALFETSHGTVHIANGGELLVVAQATQAASIGRLRLELAKAVQQLANSGGTL